MKLYTIPGPSVDTSFSYTGIKDLVSIYQEYYKEEPTTIICPQRNYEGYPHYYSEIKSLIPFIVVIPGNHDWRAIAGYKGIVYSKGC